MLFCQSYRGAEAEHAQSLGVDRSEWSVPLSM